MGTTGLAAQAFGQSSASDLRSVLFQSCMIALLLGTFLIVAQTPILMAALALLEPSDELAAIIVTYYQVRIWSAPITLINFVLIGWLLGLQDAKGALWILLSITLTNVILDIVFVTYLGLKADGVALASVAAEVMGTIAGLNSLGSPLQNLLGAVITAVDAVIAMTVT